MSCSASSASYTKPYQVYPSSRCIKARVFKVARGWCLKLANITTVVLVAGPYCYACASLTPPFVVLAVAGGRLFSIDLLCLELLLYRYCSCIHLNL